MAPKPGLPADPVVRPAIAPIAPLSDAAETVERILSRRRLVVANGDIIIERASGGLQSTQRFLYRLCVRGEGYLPERFASFAHAAAMGEDLARERRVRLFYLESEHEPPFLLKDAG